MAPLDYSTKEAVVSLEQRLPGTARIEPGDRSLTGGETHAIVQHAIREKAFEAIRERRGVADRNKTTVHAVADDRVGTAARRGHDGDSARHRLEHDHPEAFFVGAQREDGGALIQPNQRLRVRGRHEAHAIAQAQAIHLPPEPIVWTEEAREHEPHCLHARRERPKRLQQQRDVLPRIVEAADAKDVGIGMTIARGGNDRDVSTPGWTRWTGCRGPRSPGARDRASTIID
jgi:hypothetical protein